MAHDDHPIHTTSFLGELADSLCGALADHSSDVLVHLRSAEGHPEVGILPLEGQAPADLLLGTVAPDEWMAMGVACRGRVRPLDGVRGEVEASSRAEAVVLVHRSGEVVGRMRVDGAIIDDPPAYGLTLDALQRALGLPTAPPLVPTGELFAATWLENVVHAASKRRRPVTWAQVSALHPAIQLLATDGPAAETAELSAAARALARVCDWEHLRWMAVDGRWRERSVTPTEAAWFDAGAFSRWVMADRLPVDRLLADVKRASGPPIARRCIHVLRELGIGGCGQP